MVEDAFDEPDKDEESVALKRPLNEPDVVADGVCVIKLQIKIKGGVSDQAWHRRDAAKHAH